MRVLVVDDTKPNRIVARLMLCKAGHEVVEAGDGTEALRVLQEAAFDAVLLDLRMPGLSGVEVCRAARADARLKALRIVACSAHVLEHERQGLMAEGFDHLLLKPIDRTRLLAAIDPP